MTSLVSIREEDSYMVLPVKYMPDGRSVAHMPMCGFGIEDCESNIDSWYFGASGSLYSHVYEMMEGASLAGYGRFFMAAPMGTYDGNPAANLIAGWDSSVLHSGSAYQPPMDGGSGALIAALRDGKSAFGLQVIVGLRWSLPVAVLSSSSSSSSSSPNSSNSSSSSSSPNSSNSSSSSSSQTNRVLQLNRWAGSEFPNLSDTLTVKWLRQNLQPLVGVVDCVAIYGAFSPTRSLTYGQCVELSNHLMINFGMRVIWLDPELGVDSGANIPQWFLNSAPIIMRYKESSPMQSIIRSDSSLAVGREIHLASGSYSSGWSKKHIINDGVHIEMSPGETVNVGKPLEFSHNVTIISKLACDSRTASGTMSLDNNYLASSAKNNSKIRPCFAVSCLENPNITADVARSRIPAWWFSGNPQACVDHAAKSLVASEWVTGLSQADLKTVSPYGTFGAEKAADMFFDLALTLSPLAAGSAECLFENGIHLSLEHFGSPLPPDYCDTVNQELLDIYPFLFMHPEDATYQFSDPLSSASVFSKFPLMTPFMANGIQQSSLWMKKFLNRFAMRSNRRSIAEGNSPFVPWVNLISFDHISHPSSVHAACVAELGSNASCAPGSPFAGIWPGIASSERFSTEKIPGLAFGTMRAEFSASDVVVDQISRSGSVVGSYSASAVKYDQDAKMYPQNRAFSLWYDRTMRNVALAALQDAALDIIKHVYPKCRFAIPGISCSHSDSIPNLASEFVADRQGVRSIADSRLINSPVFPYINTAQFGSELIQSPLIPTVGGYNSYEVFGNGQIKDGSNRSDWVIGGSDREVLVGVSSSSIKSRDLEALRTSMQDLHALYISRWISGSGLSNTKICYMPLVGLRPKGGFGDMRSGFNSSYRALPDGFESTKYHISASKFSQIIDMHKVKVFYDIDQARSRAEWEELVKSLVTRPIAAEPSEESTSGEYLKISYTSNSKNNQAKSVKMSFNNGSALIKCIDANGGEISRRSIVADNLTELSRQLATSGIDVQLPHALRTQSVSSLGMFETSLGLGSSYSAPIVRVDAPEPASVFEMAIYTTSPDPTQASRLSTGGYVGDPLQVEIGKITQGFGFFPKNAADGNGRFVNKDISNQSIRVPVTCPNLVHQFVYVGRELMRVSVSNNIMSIHERFRYSVHRQGESIYLLNSNILQPMHQDGEYAVRCIAIVDRILDTKKHGATVNLTGLPSKSHAVLELPNRQGFMIKVGKSDGFTLSSIDRPSAIAPGDVLVELNEEKFSKRHIVSSASADKVNLTTRAALGSDRFWYMPSPSRFSMSDVITKNIGIVNQVSEGSVSFDLPNFETGFCAYVWLAIKKSDAVENIVSFRIDPK